MVCRGPRGPGAWISLLSEGAVSDVTLMTLMTLMTMMMMVTENITDTTNNCIALLCFAVFLFRQIVRTNVIHYTLDMMHK